ncbi:hypothetical protein [Paraburkholderia tropica]|nr:hypothetical protein [Paraburkholderia tropica]
MNIKTIIFLILVPIFNIALNTFASKTAKQDGGLIGAIWSPMFLLTMCVGTASVLCMIGLYRQQLPLSKGILFMGAMSILGGTLWGIWYSKTQLNTIDWIIFALIATSMLVKFSRLAG